MTPFGLAILLGAFLLFQVQPILGKCVIPWFGGGAGTWTTCILFFQLMLLGGYAYAHLLGRRLPPRRQVQVHMALLGLSLVFLPLATDAESWQAAPGAAPELGIGLLLLLRVGLPYLVLSATGPLFQAWFHSAWSGRSPYRLYALSNLGSLLALCSYPFLFEPVLALPGQGLSWSGGYVAYAICAVLCARQLWRGAAGNAASALEEPSDSAPAETTPWALWLGLSAAGSLLLMATTSLTCQDLTAMPLLWVLPLALYLGTFILSFDHAGWYRRAVFLPLLLVGLVLVNLTLHEVLMLSMWWQVGLYSMVLFCGCMVCHGELARSKPPARQLTSFYLFIATGGALGGLFSVVVAPLLFPDFWEYHLALLLVLLLAVLGGLRSGQRAVMPRWAVAGGGLAWIGLAVSLVNQVIAKQSYDSETVRNFYGVLHVQRRFDAQGRALVQMIHGRTIHGTQLLQNDQPSWPTTYFGRLSGIGIAMTALHERGPLRVGVIGLGAGTIAALARTGDTLRFYEINPEVERVAREHFTYLRDSAAQVDVVIGDGRLALAQEAERGEHQDFDLLAVDAFNSDAVPVHLLTREAMAVYVEHLRDDGTLAFHVSNRYVDLLPVVRGLARDAGFTARLVEAPGEPQRAGTIDTQWLLLSRDPAFANHPLVQHLAEPDAAPDAAPEETLWSDDFASLLPLLKAEEQIRGRWRGTPLGGAFVVDGGDLLAQVDEDHLLLQLRRLYGETDGSAPLVVATFRQPPAGASTAGYGATLYHRLQLVGEAQRYAVLLAVCAGRREAVLELGPGWSPAQRRILDEAVSTRLDSALGSSAASRAIVASVEELAQRIRSDRALAVPPRAR